MIRTSTLGRNISLKPPTQIKTANCEWRDGGGSGCGAHPPGFDSPRSTGCRIGGLFPVFISSRSSIFRVASQWDYDVPVVYKALCGFGDLQKDAGCVYRL